MRVAITGANCGVGRATAEALAAVGAEVILACRSRERAADALSSIEGARFVHLDLADLASVRRAAASLRGVDVLVNNAGVGGTRGVTRDGFELAFGVNHLGHYLLTRLVRPRRVVHLGSGSHERAPGLELDRVRGRTRTLLGLREYAHSKLCVMLAHRALVRRGAHRALVRRGAHSVVADPGDVASEAWRHVPWPVRAVMTCRMAPPEEGARTPVYCVRAALPPGGLYCGEAPRAPAPLALDDALAERLWAFSARLVDLPA